MDIHPAVIVLAHSEPWCSTIRRNFGNVRLMWVLNAEGLINASESEPGAAAIVEIRTDRVKEVCNSLFQLSNNPNHLKLFAVGSDRLLEWSPLLRACGFSAWYWSLLQTPELTSAVAKHHSNIRRPHSTIESKVGSTLPWPGAATQPQA